MESLTYVLKQLAWLLLFAGITWGWGAPWLTRCPQPSNIEERLGRLGLTLAAGLATEMVVLQWLAVSGLLRFGPILLLTALGAGLALWTLRRADHRAARRMDRPASVSAQPALAPPVPWMWQLLLAATVLYKLVATLQVPQAWDELMYHLPHAKAWADAGQLTVNGALRYPWFPYNFNLLYAASLVVADDVFTHLIHALAGWTVAVLVWAYGSRHYGRTTATVATAVWMLLSNWFYGTAYVELGLTLMIFGAALVLWEALGTPASPARDAGLVQQQMALCGLLAGSALGIKYQAVLYVPILALMVAAAPRTRRHGLVFVLAAVVPCVYWYARNAWMTGNPLQPLAGSLFGYTDWNAEDYRLQAADLRRVADGLPWVIAPALLTPWTWLRSRWRAPLIEWLTSPPRQHLVFVAWALAGWGAVASGYSRYLMPAFPVLAWMAAIGWLHLLGLLSRRGPQPGSTAHRRWQVGGVTLAAILCLVAAISAHHQWRKVATTPQARETRLQTQVTGYAALQALQRLAPPSARVYQVGLEDAIYHAPWPMWGDHFGPWRYRDRLALSTPALACRLAAEGFSTLIVHEGRFPEWGRRSDIGQHFDLTLDQPPIKAYAVRPTGPCHVP